VEHYIGVDLHQSFFQACAVDALGVRQWEDRFPTTGEGVQAFVARCPDARAIAVEASGPTWAFVDQVARHVATVCVVDPARTRLKAGFVAKTDRLDARRLADALRRDSVASVYVPPVAVRELRELCRYRGCLVRLRVLLKQRIHALLARQGVEMPPLRSLFGRAGQAWLATVAVRPRARQALEGLRALLEAVDTQIAQAAAAVDAEAAADPIVTRLLPIPGIGPWLGLLIRAEVGAIERFPTAAHLASYAGVVPRVSQSGRSCHYGGVTKRGAPWLRWALTEAAVHGPRRQDPVGRWARRLALKKGAAKARTAIARALCDEIHTAWRLT
jgi:transposase